MAEKIRIVSDLHLGHRASVLESFRSLRPLADGVDTLILNGDTLELNYGVADRERHLPAEKVRLLEEETRSWGIKTVLITGNHDPAISALHYLELRQGDIFITHGDALFPEIAPWSSNVENLRRCTASIEAERLAGDPRDLAGYLQKYKQASIDAYKLNAHYNPTVWGKLKIFFHQTWPPTTPFKILNCWRKVPDQAIALTERFGLAPRFIIVGHTHNPGVWRRGDTTIINLGSYFPWPGARCVDIVDDSLSVRVVHKRKDCVRLGRAVARFAIRPATLAESAPDILPNPVRG